ncbi:MAG TPA: hypothetical protein VLQ92_04745, partial [Candidatus Limnocylindrales bacterium]|nr:hypothetical protein [Candidatus Limnocylindrales bacterium]
LLGAVAVGLVNALLDAIMAWALDKPQYGAFAAPIAVLFILQLLSLVLSGSACLAAGISDSDVPLEELEPSGVAADGPTITGAGGDAGAPSGTDAPERAS